MRVIVPGYGSEPKEPIVTMLLTVQRVALLTPIVAVRYEYKEPHFEAFRVTTNVVHA